jgi:Carboxypeptidase regulatory-like domain
LGQRCRRFPIENYCGDKGLEYMPQSVCRFLYATTLALLLAGYLFGQAESGTIVGTVTDQAGSVVPGANVTVVNEGTQFTRVLTTNNNGQYDAEFFPTGRITITVEHPGFEKLVRTGVVLTAADTLTINLQLTVGNVQETLEVTAEAPLLQLQTAAVTTLINNTQMLETPLNGRMFTQLIELSSGASPTTPGMTLGGLTGYGMRINSTVSINGATAQNNSYLIDGIYDIGLWVNNAIIVPTIDSIQEERIMGADYSAQYGAAAGAVTVVQSKQGTNNFHGSAYEFLRNSDLDANTFFNDKNGVPKAPFRRNEFGGTIGGPIRKDKTFFFADYQGIRVAQPTTTTDTIPTLAQQQMVETGNFSNFSTTIYNPYSITPAGLRTPFAGNMIPAQMLDPAAIKTMELLPTPTSSGTSNNFIFNPVTSQRVDQFDIRGDQNFGSADRFFFKYSYDNSTGAGSCILPPSANSPVTVNPTCLNANPNSSQQRNWSATANYVKVFSPTVINELRIGAVRNYLNIFLPDNNIPIAQELGIPNIDIGNLNQGIPDMAVTGFLNPLFGSSSSYPEFEHVLFFQYEDVLTMTRGNHTFKFGGVAFRDRFDGHTSVYPRGAYDFNGQFTRQIGTTTAATSLSDFALGAFDSVQRSEQFGDFGARRWRTGIWAEDSWRATPRLTLTYGLRWELMSPYEDVSNRWSNLSIETGTIILPNSANNHCGRSMVCLDLDTPAPRLGVAYVLDKSQKTVFRGGGGISYFWGNNGGRMMHSNPPMNIIQQFTTNATGSPAMLLSQGLPLPVQPNLNDPSQLSQIFWAFDPHMKLAQNMNWSGGIQRQLRQDLMLDVAYVGSRTNEMMNPINPNEALPGPGPLGPRRPLYTINPAIQDIEYRTNYGAAKYHSMQTNLDKRYGHGLTGHFAWTWSHNMSNSVGPNSGSPPQNSFCTACEWGPVTEDRRHMVVINHVYELPFGSGRQFLSTGLLSKIVGDWNLSGIWTFTRFCTSRRRMSPFLSTK